MKNVILVIAGFILYHIGFKYFETIMLFLDKAIHYRLASYFVTYIVIGIPIFIATYLINNDLRVFDHLGLGSGFVRGLLVAALFSLPMFIGGLLQSKIVNDINVPNMIAKTVLAGLFEELYFRGFFFGQLYKKTRLGFLPSILFCSLVFASGHLYQSHDPSVLAGVFTTTFLGSLLFAWLFVEWSYNLWVPIFLHTFMNLSWYIFSISSNALGGINSNVFRGLTIALSIIVTILYKRRKGEQLAINRKTLFLKRDHELAT